MRDKMKRGMRFVLALALLAVLLPVGAAQAQGATVYRGDSDLLEASFQYTEGCGVTHIIIHVEDGYSTTSGKRTGGLGTLRLFISYTDTCNPLNSYIARSWKFLEEGELVIAPNRASAALRAVVPVHVNNIYTVAALVEFEWLATGRPHTSTEKVGRPGCPDSYQQKLTSRPATASGMVYWGLLTYKAENPIYTIMEHRQGMTLSGPPCKGP
jgi:hypothetical protein